MGLCIKTPHTDRSGEFTSQEFNAFFNGNGISRQLTTAYTPQQNEVTERKDRTIINMFRNMFSKKKILRTF
jgi:transposase InsO family protein